MQLSDATSLFNQGILAFAEMERAGIALDVPYLLKQQKRYTREIIDLKEELNATPEGRMGQKMYGRAWDVTNTNQLVGVLQRCGHSLTKTAKGNASVDKAALTNIGGGFSKTLQRIRSLEKITGTYISGWLREVGPDGYMHPSFNLHTVRTFRSSSSNPNFQNVPRRDKEAQAILRRAIIPSAGNQLLEVDYGAMEVRIIAAYTKDPVLVDYIRKGKDMHKDCAGWVFAEPSTNVSKEMRDIIKNQFVFPEFYGSWFKACADNIWPSITRFDLKTVDGVSLKTKWRTQEDFVAQVKRAEEKQFWKRFSETRQWQEQWYAKYLQTGRFKMLTGFECSGVMSRNDLFNWPVQGAAFHCLLWSLIRIINEMKRRGMQSRCIGQIHDSGVFDVYPPERDDLIELVTRVMTTDIRKEWKWINVPLLAEVEITPIDGSWLDKKAA